MTDDPKFAEFPQFQTRAVEPLPVDVSVRSEQPGETTHAIAEAGDVAIVASEQE